MTSFFSTQTQVALIDTRNNPGTIQLPAATTFAYRTLLVKDIYGTFATKSLTLTTSGSDTFEDGTTSKVLTTNSGFIQVYAGQSGKWYILSATDVLQFKVSSLQVSTILGPLPQISTISLFTSNTSNYFLPTLSNNYSTNLSTIALFTSNTSNYFQNTLQNWSTPLSTTALFTSNTSNYFQNSLQNWSTPLSTTALFTSNTSNYFQNTLQNWSTPLSTTALFTSNTSNYFQNTLQNWSTADSTIALFTSNTSNYYKNNLQDWSTQQTTIYTFTSNTSNYYTSLLLLDVSTLVTSSFTSTIRNLGIAGYISSSQLISSVGNLLSNAGQANLISSLIGLGTFGYISTLSLQSTVSFILNNNTGVTPAQLISSVDYLLSNTGGTSQTTINSTIQGLGTYSYVSSLSLQSTVTNILANASGISQQNLTSSLIGLGTFGYLSSFVIPAFLSTSALLTSSIRTSTLQTNTLFASSINTSSLITSTAYVSSLNVLSETISSSFISSLIVFAENVSSLNVSTLSSFFTNTSTLTTTQINFGSGFGYLIMPDIQPNTVYTSTVTTSNIYIGFNSNQSYAAFYGAGAYTNSVIFESNIGGTNQELAFFRGASASDRIRLQTTGYIVFEPGVASRTFPSVGSNATPAMVITTASNVGIQTFAPSYPLDVTGVARATTSFSTFLVQTSNIQTTNLQTSNVSTISSVAFAQYVLNTSYVVGSTFLLGGVNAPFLTGGPGEVRLTTNNTTRMYINTAGNTGFGLTNPSYQVHITSNLYASSITASSIVASSITSFLTLSSVQTFTSSLTGNSFGATNMSGSNIYSSTFTGKWNDAIYFTLQEI